MKIEGNLIKENKVSFTYKKVVDLFIAYELDIWSRDLNAEFTFKNLFIWSCWVEDNAYLESYSFSGHGDRFDSRSRFSVFNDWVKNVIIFDVEDSSSAHSDNRKKLNLNSW